MTSPEKKRREPLPVNQYGNIDVRYGAPDGFVHIKAKRLTVTCAAIGVECAPALVGWRSGRYKGPIIYGVVVRQEDEEKVRAAMARRAARRLTPEQKRARRERQHERDAANMAARIRARYPSMPELDVVRCASHATEIGSGRVGRSTVAEDPIRAAVVAYARHRYTRYDEYLAMGYDREESRDEVNGEVREIVSAWEEPNENK